MACLLLPSVSRAQAPPYYNISTVAGNGTQGYSGDGGAATSAEFNGPFDVIVDSSGNLYISDSANFRVRKVSGTNISTIAGNGTQGYGGNNGSATSAELNSPAGLAFDSSSNLYIADGGNYVVWKIAGSNINVVAGNNSAGAGFSGDLGPATSAQMINPSGVAVDSAGNLYISDPATNVVREVCASKCPAWGGTSGEIDTYAGSTSLPGGYAGDGGQSNSPHTQLQNPRGLAVDSAGNLYIADSDNHVIRKVTAATGVISTVAGNGVAAYSGDGGLAIQASLFEPKGVAVDSNGYIYIADTDNCVIRVVEPNGIITTVAGNFKLGCAFSGDGGLAQAAQLAFPSGVTVSGGKVYIADNGNQRIRLLTPIPVAPVIPKINAGGVVTASAFGAFNAVAPGSWIEIYGTNLAGDTRSWASTDFTGTNGEDAPIKLDGVTVTVGGESAFIDYISPTQVNVQVPSNVSAGTQPVILSTESGTSSAYSVKVNATDPGFWAPTSFKIGGNQYAGATTTDGKTYILPTGAVSGLTSQPASPGDTIVLYGVGFGSVTPNIPAGQIVGQQNALTSTLQISFGGVPATSILYMGLAPNYVGLYQFDVVVPTVAAGNLVPLTFTLGGVSGTQTLYIAIGN